MVVDAICLQNCARELLQQVIFFVGGAIRADDPNGLTTLLIADVGEVPSDQLKGFFPGGGEEASFFANERLGQAIFVIGKVKSVAALDAEEVAVDAAFVAVVAAHDFHAGVGAAHTQSGFASVGAVGAGGANVVHLPGTRLVAVSARGERAHWANVDAVAALFTFEMVAFVGSDDGGNAAVLHAESPDVHGLSADAHAAIAQNASRAVEEDHWRPLLFVAVVLGLDVFRFRRAVGERHILEFTLAAGVADGAVQGMVAEQHFNHRLAGLMDLKAVGGDDHALADHGGAGGL